jgi:hypothetical protein
MPSLFKDFGKAAKDLLGKNYDFGDHKVEVSSRANDVDFSAEWGAKGAGKVETVFALPQKAQLTLEGDASNKVTGTVKAKNLMAGGTVKVKGSTRGNIFLGFEYLKEAGTFSIDVDESQKGRIVNASCLMQQNKLLLGGCAQMDAHKTDIMSYSLGLGYVEDGVYQVSAKLSDTPAKEGTDPSVLFQFIHFCSPRLSYAAKYTRSVSDSPKSDCEFGGVYKLNEQTKVGLKVSNSAHLGMHAMHQLNDQVSLTQSMRLNVSDLAAPGAYGMSLKFKL